MQRAIKILLVASGALIVVAAAAAGAATLWLRDRLQTTEYCSSCHVVARYYESWKDSEFTAHAHGRAGVDCHACHTRTIRDGLRELVVNSLPRGEPSILDHRADVAECLRCHGSHKVLATLTGALVGPDGYALGRNPHDSHWGPLDCGICHRMHGPSVDFCSNCHGAPASGPAWLQTR